MSGELIDTTEMYLRTIYELEEEGITPLRARIAERLEQSGPTVSQTVARMERDGLLHVAAERRLVLSEEGRTRAVRVMRKHRLAERLLVDVLGLDWSVVHEEACRWEHVMSDRVERRIVDILDIPLDSPYGNPIPGLAELMADAPTTPMEPTQNVVMMMGATSEPHEVVLRRFGEPLQKDAENMSFLAERGLKPGVTLTVRQKSDEYHLSGVAVEEVVVPRKVAMQLFVAGK